MRHSGPWARAYHLLVDRDRDRDVDDLPDRLAAAVPGNALKQVGALALQKAGDLVVDPKTTLVWLLTAVGAPTAMTGLLVPVREAGSMLPQVMMVGWVRRRPLRRPLWLLAAAGQAVAAVGMALVAVSLEGVAAGVAVVVLLAGFATARALGSLTAKDVLGKTMPAGHRGRVTGAASVASGAVAISLGVALRVTGAEQGDPVAFGVLLAGGAGAWVLAAAVFSRVVEEPGEVDADDAGAALRRAVVLLRDDRDFRRFVLARGLLLVSALSPPFVVTIASREGAAGLRGLGPFIFSAGVASLIGGRLWGARADRSSRAVMTRAAAMASTVIAVLLTVLAVGPAVPLLLPTAYLLLALAHEGARIGRKTYVVDLAEGNRRTDYVAVSNTVMAIVLLGVGALTAAVATAGAEWGLAVLAVLGVLAAIVAQRLPEVEPAG